MDVEKPIKALLRQRARNDARFNAKFDRAAERFRKWQRQARLDCLEQTPDLNYKSVFRLLGSERTRRSESRRLGQPKLPLHRELDRLEQTQAARERALKKLIESSKRRKAGTKQDRARHARQFPSPAGCLGGDLQLASTSREAQ